jgi:hypothetical protein
LETLSDLSHHGVHVVSVLSQETNPVDKGTIHWLLTENVGLVYQDPQMHFDNTFIVDRTIVITSALPFSALPDGVDGTLYMETSPSRVKQAMDVIRERLNASQKLSLPTPLQ